MARRILDTNVLIGHWRRCRAQTNHPTADNAERWGEELVRLYNSNLIVTPVRLEFLAGTRSAEELQLADAYLLQFFLADEGRIAEEDWKGAERLSRRVPRDGSPRHLGDCLIRAIANRLRLEVFSLDSSFPT